MRVWGGASAESGAPPSAPGQRWRGPSAGSAAGSRLLSSAANAVPMTTVGIGCRRGDLLPATPVADPNAVPALCAFLGRDDPRFNLDRHLNSCRARAEDAGPTHKNYERPSHCTPQSVGRRRPTERGPSIIHPRARGTQAWSEGGWSL